MKLKRKSQVYEGLMFTAYFHGEKFGSVRILAKDFQDALDKFREHYPTGKITMLNAEDRFGYGRQEQGPTVEMLIL